MSSGYWLYSACVEKFLGKNFQDHQWLYRTLPQQWSEKCGGSTGEGCYWGSHHPVVISTQHAHANLEKGRESSSQRGNCVSPMIHYRWVQGLDKEHKRCIIVREWWIIIQVTWTSDVTHVVRDTVGGKSKPRLLCEKEVTSKWLRCLVSPNRRNRLAGRSLGAGRPSPRP